MATVSSVTVVRRGTRGNSRYVIADIKLDTSYATNGDVLTVAQQRTLMPELGNILAVDMSKVEFFRAETSQGTTPARLTLALDKTNNKLIAMQMSGTAGEVANATNLSAQTVRCEFLYMGAFGV